MDIKELALKIAEGTPGFHWDGSLFAFTDRLFAAYLAEQKPVAWAYCPECGSEEIHYEEGRHKQCSNCHQEWFSDIDYSDVVQSNLSKLFTAPPEPAPQMPLGVSEGTATSACAAPLNAPPSANWTEDFGHENGQYQCKCFKCEKIFTGHKRRVVCKLCAAPSSEEAAQAVKDLRERSKWDYGNTHKALLKQAADLIELLAARVPDERIAELEQQNAELVAALKGWDALIKYNYSGSREAMSAMQQCAFDTADLLSKVKQP